MSTKRRKKHTRWGPSQREVLALLLIALGLVTLLGLLSITRGTLIDIWVRALQQIFGLGTYFVVFMFLAAGFFLLQRNLSRHWTIQWEKVVGFETSFLAALGLLHLGIPGEDPMTLAQTGSGGGYVGWAISSLLAEMFGYEICAAILVALAAWGIVVMSPLTVGGIWEWLCDVVSRVPKYVRERFSRLSTASHGEAGEDNSPVVMSSPSRASAKEKKSHKKKKTDIPINSAPSKRKKLSLRASEPVLKARKEGKLPSLNILDKASPQSLKESEILRRAQIIEETLEGFGLPVKVVEINRGPAVTQYGVEPGLIERRVRNGEPTYSRVRVNKISALINDLSLALAAAPLRIEAPVPGRSIVGIEVPNQNIAVVALRTVMESEAFVKMKSRLKIALGQDTSGISLVADLAGMPHLLIAGATGSGKSVCINAIICGLLFNNTPEQLRLLLIDPKMVELTGYNGIPHLLSPVVTETDQIVGALTWVTRLMEERYRLFSQNRVRNTQEYNRKVARKADVEQLPYLVVVIDELADLMMAAPTEVEWAICRIAQMARATGIHLILATQRPSVDVVTGLIKANFPARISFAVTSQIDSRVIIDGSGAETLLGRGDMLFIAPDSSRAIRVQGCFVSDKEVDKLVNFWTTSSEPEEPRDDTPYPWTGLAKEEKHDDLFDDAVELVRKNGKASASFLQRRLRIGYPRAARLMDQLEEEGVIEQEENGNRYREVADVETEHWDVELEEDLDTNESS